MERRNERDGESCLKFNSNAHIHSQRAQTHLFSFKSLNMANAMKHIFTHEVHSNRQFITIFLPTKFTLCSGWYNKTHTEISPKSVQQFVN